MDGLEIIIENLRGMQDDIEQLLDRDQKMVHAEAAEILEQAAIRPLFKNEINIIKSLIGGIK